MKKLALIATIFIVLALVFAPSHLALAGSTWNSNANDQGAADTTTGEAVTDLQTNDDVYYDVLQDGEIMEIATNVTNGWTSTTGTTINHARLHIIYKTGAGYGADDYVQYGPGGASYTDTGIMITVGTTEHEAYWEFPRSAIDTWTKIENMGIKLQNTSGNKDIFIELLQIIVTYDATFASYSDSGRNTPEDHFDSPSKQTVYMKGTGLEAGLEYKIAYYMDTGGADDKVEVDVDTGSDLLTSNCLITSYYDFSDTETWAAVVFHPATITAPDTYAAALTSDYYVIDDTFMVYITIPEFPTIFAAIGVAGLCFGIYYWMRKRRLAYVKG